MIDLDTNTDSLAGAESNGSVISAPAAMLMRNEINGLRRQRGYPDANFGDSPEEFLGKIQSMKAITGAPNNGANVSSIATNRVVIGSLNGGAFRASGINAEDAKTLVINLNGMVTSSGYGLSTFNSEYVVDSLQNTVGGDVVTLLPRKINLVAREEIISGSTEGTDIIAGLLELANLEKFVLEDAVAAVTATTSGTALNPALVNSSIRIHSGMAKLIGRNGQNKANGQKPKFYINHETFAEFLITVDANGRIQDCPYIFKYSNPDTMSEGADFVIGRFGGYEVVLVSSDEKSGLLNSYQVNAAGSITNQTGGNNTVILFGIPIAMTLGKLVGNPNMDRVNVYSGANGDQIADLNGRIQVVGTVAIGAGLSIPKYWNYFALQI